MNCNRCDYVYISIIIGIIAGVIAGVLYGMGFIGSSVFNIYLAIGIIGVFVAPLYVSNDVYKNTCCHFCKYKRLYISSVVGTILSSALGLILLGFDLPIILAIVFGIATFFVTVQLVLIIFIVKCICAR